MSCWSHAKIDNRAPLDSYMWLEQVQLFQQGQAPFFSLLYLGNRERGEGHGDELNTPDPPRKPRGRRSSSKKKDRFSRSEVKETSVDAVCAATWERLAAFYSGALSFWFLFF